MLHKVKSFVSEDPACTGNVLKDNLSPLKVLSKKILPELIKVNKKIPKMNHFTRTFIIFYGIFNPYSLHSSLILTRGSEQ